MKLSYLIISIKDSIKELNPWQNIQKLHTNVIADILAGIMVAIIALPLALAFGEMSQLGPEAGIWSAIVGGVIGGLFGGCMVGVSGPTAPMASQIAAFMGFFVIGTSNDPDLVAAFSIIFLSGLILVVISFLKISRFIHYIPYSVIAGFMCGIGVIIIITQINSFVGLESKSNIPEIFKNIGYTFQNIQIEALYVSIPSLLILLNWNFFQTKFKFLENIPSTLIALIVGTGIANIMNFNIPYIGDQMNGAERSQLFSFYLPDLKRFGEFVNPAFALAGLAILDSLLSCKVADNMTGIRHSSDRETFGQGMANMVAGLVGGISTATATTQTIGNITFGARSPLATIVKGLTFLAILSGLGYLVESIPNACLAAILFKLGIDILDYRILPILKKIPRNDLFIFTIVLFVTIYEDIMIAVAVGVVFALLSSIKEFKFMLGSSYQHSVIPFVNSELFQKEQDIQEIEKLSTMVLKLNGPLFFGSIESLIRTYSFAPKHKMLIIDMSTINMIDLTGAFALEDLVHRTTKNDIKVFIYNANLQVKKVLLKVNFFGQIKEDFYKDSIKSINSIVLDNFNKND